MGELEINVARTIEKVNTRNLKSVVEYSKMTRQLQSESDLEVVSLKKLILQQNLLLDQLKGQVNMLLIKTKDLGR